MEAASVSGALSMIHSLSPSVRCPLLLPSLPPRRCSPPVLLFLADGCTKAWMLEGAEVRTADLASWVIVNPTANMRSILFLKVVQGGGAYVRGAEVTFRRSHLSFIVNAPPNLIIPEPRRSHGEGGRNN